MSISFKLILIYLSLIYFLLEIINNKFNVTQLECYILFLTYRSTPSENSSLLGCDTGLLGEWFLTFRRSVVHVASGSTSPFLLRLLHEDGGTTRRGTTCPMMQYHISEDLNIQQHIMEDEMGRVYSMHGKNNNFI